MFISAGNEPSGHACMDMWRLPRGGLSACGTCLAPTEAQSKSPAPWGVSNLMPRCLQRGLWLSAK